MQNNRQSQANELSKMLMAEAQSLKAIGGNKTALIMEHAAKVLTEYSELTFVQDQMIETCTEWMEHNKCPVPDSIKNYVNALNGVDDE